MHFICLVPVSPLRAEPSHRSEMVSQLLFGEIAEMLEDTGDFVKVKMLNDGYDGWCQAVQLQVIDYHEYPVLLAARWSNKVLINGETAIIPFGSSLSFMEGNKTTLGSYEIEYNGGLLRPLANAGAESLRQVAFQYLNTPYLWGGRSVFGIDCSGFVQQVYQCFGIALHRDASHQATQGDAIGFLQEAKPGDLAFFDNEEGKIIHVGILLSADTIIHASGKVRIDTIDSMGIVNSDTGRRTHKLRIVKRISAIG